MAKSERRHFTEEFRREAVFLTQTSGRTVDQVADDPGPGRSTLNRWRKKLLEAELPAGPHADPARVLPIAPSTYHLLRSRVL